MRKDAVSNPQALADYIEGVWALKRQPADDPRYSRYDWYVLWHAVAMMTDTPPGNSSARNAAHSGPAFLPWHRFYLKRLQSEIADILGKPDFAIPYWNWVANGQLSQADQRTAPIWDNTAMGGSGTPVADGPFKFDPNMPNSPDNWVVRIVMGSGGLFLTNRGLDRRLAMDLRRLPSASSTLTTVLRGTYDTTPWDRTSASIFRNELEGWRGGGMHNRVHGWVGGDMGLGHSPNDPMFFLHHCNADRIWAFWQQRNGATSYAPDDTASQGLLMHRLSDDLLILQNDPVPTETIANMLAEPTAQYDSFADLQTLVDQANLS